MVVAKPARLKPLPILLILPCVALLLSVTIAPFVYALVLSFFQWGPTTPEKKFVGLGNYASLVLGDERFVNSLEKTAIFVSGSLTLEFLLGLGLALILASKPRLRKIAFSILILPIMIPPIVVGYTWQMFFTMRYGAVNQILSSLMNSPVEIRWLSDEFYSYFVPISADLWQWTPFVLIVLLAGLLALPIEPLEAARVDGASRWQIFRHVTLPLLRPIILVVIMLRALEITKIFEYIWLTTMGGPGITTESTTIYIYMLAFKYFSLGYAAAAAFLFMLFATILISIFIRLMRRKAS